MQKRSITVVRKIGDSLGVILPIQILRAHGIARGDECEVHSAPDGAIVLIKIETIT